MLTHALLASFNTEHARGIKRGELSSRMEKCVGHEDDVHLGHIF